LASFYTFSYFHRVRREGEDKLWCTPPHKGKFDVCSFYKIVTCKDASPFPWKSIWQTKVPLKVSFAWLAALGKILTMDNSRRGMSSWSTGTAYETRMG
jgi:hypothetical protein